MNKNDLLKMIAQKGYDVGFGAKKHFATYDIIEKAPGWIGFASTTVGVLGLVFDSLSTKLISAVFVIVGVSGLYISFYNHEKQTYDDTGTKIIRLCNELKALYFTVKGLPDNSNFQPYIDQLNEIENIRIVLVSRSWQAIGMHIINFFGSIRLTGWMNNSTLNYSKIRFLCHLCFFSY